MDGEYSTILGIGLVAVVSVPYILMCKMAQDSLDLGLRGRLSLKMVEAGDNISNHRWIFDDVRCDYLARVVMGKKNLERAIKLRDEYEKSFLEPD